MLRSVCGTFMTPLIGSIPEKDPSDGNVYNTSTVYSPQGECDWPTIVLDCVLTFAPGGLVAIHRKVHLFDIDIPGKIKFKVATSLVSIRILSHVDSGKRDADWWLDHQLFRYGQGILLPRRSNLQLMSASRVCSCRVGHLL